MYSPEYLYVLHEGTIVLSTAPCTSTSTELFNLFAFVTLYSLSLIGLSHRILSYVTLRQDCYVSIVLKSLTLLLALACVVSAIRTPSGRDGALRGTNNTNNK